MSAGEGQKKGLLLDVLSADQFTVGHISQINGIADTLYRRHDAAVTKAELRRRAVAADLDRLPEEVIAGITGGDPVEQAVERMMEYAYRSIGRQAAYFWFEEASTRTVGSFNAARSLLGLARLGHTGVRDTSLAQKDESFEDTMMVANSHLRPFAGAVAVLRTSQPGMPHRAADILDVPVINAGDGQNEHPTQALLDIYTIKRRLGRVEGLNVVLGGDPRYGRTIHSLAKLLALYPDNKLTFVGDDDTWLDGSDTKTVLDERGADYQATTELDPLSEADVVYWTRLQTERMDIGDDKKRALDEYGRKYAITEEILRWLPEEAIIMHPLPRGPELPPSIDTDKRVAYWDQVENSTYVRAALIQMLLWNYYIVLTNEGR